MGNEFKEKAIKGVSWNLIERFGVQGMKFIIGIVLARLLTPEAFGLIGMITVFFFVAQTFIESGFGRAYIQKKEVSDKDANTIFYINLFISILLYGILWLTAPYIADFYDQPQLKKLTRVMALIIIINAFNMIQIAQLTRAVNFKRKTKITLIAIIISGSSGIAAAYYGIGIWSLVLYQLANRFIITLGLWITSRWKPALQFSVRSFKEMFSFGSWVLASELIRRIFENVNILVIGKLFPAAEVGFFNKSQEIQRMTSSQFSNAISMVSFPIYSKMQDDKIQLENSIKKFLQYTVLINTLIVISLIVVAKPFVILLLKEKWAPMIPYLQLLSVAGIIYPLHIVNRQVIAAMGKSDYNFRITMLKIGLNVLNLFIMYRWGVLYIIMGGVIVSFITLFIYNYYTSKFVKYTLLKQLSDIKKIILGAIVAGVLGYLTSYKLENLWLTLLTGGTITISLFIFFQYLINRKLLIEALNFAKSFKKN
mgnify:CR=1 FL=1